MDFRKIVSTVFLILLVFSMQAQVFFTRQGSIEFNGAVEGVEEVRAKSNKVSCALDSSKKVIRVEVPVSSFDFPIALMEKHFNENYAESDSYPKASFQGIYTHVDGETSIILVEGVISFHGQQKTIRQKASLTSKPEQIILEGEFELLPEEFNINLPSGLRKKVSESIAVKVYFELQPYQR